MIDIISANEEFMKYVKGFDISNPRIKRKKEHSVRVQNISELIAKNLNLTQEEINLAMLIGILHDIGRFEQQKQFKTFNDMESFDHGDYGAELLKKTIRNYIREDKYDNIIIESVKNHNKLIIDESLNEREKNFARIVRDADKLDIMDETINLFYKNKENFVNESDVSDYTFNFIINHKSVVTSKNVEIMYLDNIVRIIAFIFDMNYKKSFQIVKEQDYINRIIDRFDYKNKHAKIRMEEIRKIANEYVNQKI